MALNEAYGQTDVMNDPRYLYSQTQTGNRKQRKAAEDRLQMLQHERDRAQQESQFGASHAQTERLRQDSLDESKRHFDLAQAQQRDLHNATEVDSQLRAKVAQQQADTQRLNALQLQLGDPNLKDQHPAIKQEIMRIMGIQNNTTTGGVPTTGAKGEYGPGGAPVAPNAATAKKGEYGPGGAPATAASTTTYQNPTTVFTGQPAPQTGGERPAIGPTGAVDQGGGFAPNGYPILPNTLEPRYVPLGHGSLEGSTPVAGGIRTPSGGFIGTKLTPGVQNLINPGAAAAATSNPPPNESMVAAPVEGGYTLPTPAFTTGGSATQPGAALAPESNVPSLPSQVITPHPGVTIDVDKLLKTYIGDPTMQDLQNRQNSAPPVVNPQASNDRQDLLRDTENIFYGGGQAPVPTPKPVATPKPQKYQQPTQSFYA